MSLTSVIASENFNGITTAVEALLTSVAENATSIPSLKEVLDYCATTDSTCALNTIKWLYQSFQRRFLQAEEQVTIREILADHYEEKNLFNELLAVLASMPQEKGFRSATDVYQFTLYTRIIVIKQKIGEWMSVETDINKSIPLFRRLRPNDHQDHKVSVIQFLICHAVQLDKKGKYAEAAQKYYDAFTKDVTSKDVLVSSIVCALLAGVGRPRFVILTKLWNDPHTQGVPLGVVVDLALHGRRIRAEEAELLKSHLQPHHKTPLPNGETVFGTALTSHNLYAASKMYKDIHLKDLAQLLGVGSALEAEAIASPLILSGAVQASIDEIAGVMTFASITEDDNDKRVLRICDTVEAIASEIKLKYPSQNWSSSLVSAEA